MRDAVRPRAKDDANVLFDYRCHSREGTIGDELPPPVRQCLADWQSATPDQLGRDLNLSTSEASWLVRVSKRILERGFDLALRDLASDDRAAFEQSSIGRATPWSSKRQDVFFMRLRPCCWIVNDACTIIERKAAKPT